VAREKPENPLLDVTQVAKRLWRLLGIAGENQWKQRRCRIMAHQPTLNPRRHPDASR
jgi:hypothetical protein